MLKTSINLRLTILTIVLLNSCFLIGQSIPSLKVLNNSDLVNHLKNDVKDQLTENGHISEAELAKYFRTTFGERYFFNWKNFDLRLEDYKQKYDAEKTHFARAKDHMNKFDAHSQWDLPFNFKNGEAVDAYSYRHLSRQHKMLDIAFMYFYSAKDQKYLDYFIKQKHSLNEALEKGAYEPIEDGNGVYEVFRSGYRILNWLQIHNMFLGEDTYSDEEQLNTIATLLQHASHLYERNASFRSGNHQTRGMSALAMMAILFRDFEDTDLWLERALKRLGEHLDKEINDDNFQFERSVHYHMSDIGNYFYVYRLAQISDITLSGDWETRLKALFSTLAKIAYPDGSTPVLQDDTEIPWAEKNDISKIMTLGYILFEDPQIGYFASDNLQAKFYWYLKKDQLESLQNIQKAKPEYPSLHFPTTHYYIMRAGWEKDDLMMIISAGLDKDKPDHQHGDMLGIQAYAYEEIMLPNYQVRYSLKDFDIFKNSLVKNVALVDDVLQGKEWKSNKGGSGFGKFKGLPNPKVISWINEDDFDVFVGSHDGFSDEKVEYSRQVIFIKDGFWIVKDNFKSEVEHIYKQVWQGHYTLEEGPDLIRATFPDAAGFDIFQLNQVDNVISEGRRGKEWSIISSSEQTDFEFISILYPYKSYDRRLDESRKNIDLKSWSLINDKRFVGEKIRGVFSDNKYVLFNLENLTYGNKAISFDIPSDVMVELSDQTIKLTSIDDDELFYSINSISIVDQIKNYSINPAESKLISIK